MRFKTTSRAGTVAAVSGINTVSFAMMPTDAMKKGLLGFAVERLDAVENERYFMAGFKVFASVIPQPSTDLAVSTFDHPVQSFVWDDFTANPGREYRYWFHPVKGKARNLDRSGAPLSITVRTEPLYSRGEHDVFFNRGVASSQAYHRRFGTTPIDKLDAQTRAEALDWLSRDLDDALLKFINGTKNGERLLGCFYEFRYPPVTDALVAAIDRGVDVQLVLDMKDNAKKYPVADTRKELRRAKFPTSRVTARKARTSDIAHNKFMVRIRGDVPIEVWTGSTNLTPGGVAGQTNVGHWVRNRNVADLYAQYWQLLRTDPGGAKRDGRQAKMTKNAAFEKAVATLSPVPDDLQDLPTGTTALFSPRPDDALLKSYAALLDSAQRQGCITLAFGISDEFKALLSDNTSHDALIFALLERKDEPNPRSDKPFVKINAANNVYKAWGSYLREPVYQWARETTAGALRLNRNVLYVHSKFMLVDPLGEDPLVITGSANFSAPSVADNDENMLAIRGDLRATDIYYTEFNRLFNHYYFRSVTEDRSGRPDDNRAASLFLAEDDSWQRKYRSGTLRAKRLALFADMHAPKR